MPIHTGQDKNGNFYQWGKTGKKYYFKPGDEASRKRARGKAEVQQTAIYSSGWKGDKAMKMKLIRVRCKDDEGWRLDKSNAFSEFDKARDKASNAYDIAHYPGNSDAKPNVYGMEAPSIFLFNNDTDKDWCIKRVTEFIKIIPEFIKRYKKYQENNRFADKSDIRKVVLNYNAAVKLAQKWLAANK